MNAANITSAIAALVAVLTTIVIAWRQHRRKQDAYLVLALTLEEVKDDHLIIHTSLDNRSELTKGIDAVQLIVCPYEEKPEKAANLLRPDLPKRLTNLRDIANANLTEPIEGVGRAWLPLLYYTKENRWVADEILTCDAVINVSNFEPCVPYSVRLILVGPKPDRSKLYLAVHRAKAKHRAVRRAEVRRAKLYRAVRGAFFPSNGRTPRTDGGLYRVVHRSFVRPVITPVATGNSHAEERNGRMVLDPSGPSLPPGRPRTPGRTVGPDSQHVWRRLPVSRDGG